MVAKQKINMLNNVKLLKATRKRVIKEMMDYIENAPALEKLAKSVATVKDAINSLDSETVFHKYGNNHTNGNVAFPVVKQEIVEEDSAPDAFPIMDFDDTIKMEEILHDNYPEEIVQNFHGILPIGVPEEIHRTSSDYSVETDLFMCQQTVETQAFKIRQLEAKLKQKENELEAMEAELAKKQETIGELFARLRATTHENFSLKAKRAKKKNETETE